jgi:uncharacterized phiE125 gp8 family phage protein
MDPTLTLVVPPSGSVVTTAELKAHLRVLSNDEDTYIEGLQAAAVEYIESFIRCKLLTQTWKLAFTDFAEVMALTFPPLKQVIAVRFYDSDGDLITVASSHYWVDSASIPARVIRNVSYQWPLIDIYRPFPVEIEFSCGYAPIIPQAIKVAIMLLVGHWYTNREAVTIDQRGNSYAEMPFAVTSLLMPFRDWRYAC